MSDPVHRRLDELDRDQLVAVIHRLLDREPGLADLVQIPLPSERRPVHPEPVAAQVTEILLTMGDDWRASMRAERELTPLVGLGTHFLDAGVVADAHVVWRTIALTVLRHYLSIRDEESEVAGIVNECVTGLGKCLDRTTDSAARRAILDDVFAVFRWDYLEHGSFGMDEPAATILVERTTAVEREAMAAITLAALPSGSHSHARWHRQHGGRLVLRLVGDRLGPVERERVLADADLDAERLDLLVAAGRVDEAITLVRAAPGSDVADLADRLIRHGHREPARDAVRDHAGMLSTSNHHLRSWMQDHDLPLPPHLEPLLEALSRFNVWTDIGRYKALREAACASGQWPRVLDHLEAIDATRSKYQPVRARIAADRGDVGGALAELDGLKDSTWRAATEDVARSLEVYDADAALALYQKLLDDLRAHGTAHARKRADEVAERIAAARAWPSRR